MKSTIVIPDDYFRNWHFEIRRELWSALGVNRREYVDREKTRASREAAKEAGIPQSQLSRIKRMYAAYAVDNPTNFDFHEGDVFFARRSSEGIQVAVIKDEIEVHVLSGNKYVRANRLSEMSLANWLETGVEPKNTRISRYESWRELAKFHILPPDNYSD